MKIFVRMCISFPKIRNYYTKLFLKKTNIFYINKWNNIYYINKKAQASNKKIYKN